jgi:hypothetical protein
LSEDVSRKIRASITENNTVEKLKLYDTKDIAVSEILKPPKFENTIGLTTLVKSTFNDGNEGEKTLNEVIYLIIYLIIYLTPKQNLVELKL